MREFNVDYSLLNSLKQRVELAREIENARHRADKASHEQSWLRKAAEEMELDYSEDEAR